MNTLQFTLENNKNFNSPTKAAYKELPKQFLGKGQQNDFSFFQVASSEDAYMFLVIYQTQRWYEVFRKTLNYHLFIHEYPASEAFGHSAWRVATEEEAFDLFFQISGID